VSILATAAVDRLGTIPQWLSAIGTTLAFTATFYVIQRDARIRRRSQARRVSFYDEVLERGRNKDGSKFTKSKVCVENLSDETIYDVALHVIRYNDPGQRQGYERVLIPKSQVSLELWARAPNYDLVFRDASGIRWHRTYDGQLRQLTRLRQSLSPHYRRFHQ
jgi:hypothetical protein